MVSFIIVMIFFVLQIWLDQLKPIAKQIKRKPAGFAIFLYFACQNNPMCLLISGPLCTQLKFCYPVVCFPKQIVAN